MDPELLRRCMSFGFSDKKTESFIGQCKSLFCWTPYKFVYLYLALCWQLCWNKFWCIDGNGFKTSTMRLGADVVVFTRHKKNTKYEYNTFTFWFFCSYLMTSTFLYILASPLYLYREATLSVGLLSYTFLTRTGCDDIVIPTVSSILKLQNSSVVS